jgi:hypothetical protein
MTEEYESWQPKTKCVCPGCKIIHISYIFWAGKGLAKKFCKKCQKVANGIDQSFLYIEKPELHEMSKGVINTDE